MGTFDFKLVTPSRGHTNKPFVVTLTFLLLRIRFLLKKKKLLIFYNGNLLRT